MKDYDAIVIGAGNGGLTSACTLAQGGIKTLLLEQHNIPGGYATSFVRGRFEFEVALHQLSGLGSAENPGPLRKTLDELGVTNMLEWVDMGNIYRVTVPGALDIVLPANRDGVVQVLKKSFPKESDNIDAFFTLVYQCWNEFYEMFQYNYDSVDVDSKLDPESSPEKYPTVFEYAFQTTQEILDLYFRDQLLKVAVSAFASYVGPPREICFVDLAQWLYFYIEYGSYHIKGGSQALSNAILRRFLESRGEVRFNCGVSKILVDNGTVSGVVTESGEVIKARHIISNASPLTVYTEMIDNDKLPKNQLKALDGYAIGYSTFLIYAALDCDYSQIGIDEATNFVFDPKRFLMYSCYNVSNPDCSPPGTSVLSIATFQKDVQWLATPPIQYFEKKYEYAEKLLDQMEKLCPGIRGHIEEVEVATPLTSARYSRVPGGALGGFKRSSKDFFLFPMDPPLIKGLHFVGACSTISGGFHPTLIHGWATGKHILNDGRQVKEK